MIWFPFFFFSLLFYLFLSFWYKSSEKKKYHILNGHSRELCGKSLLTEATKLRSSFLTSIVSSFFFFLLTFVHFMKWQKQKNCVSCVIPTKSNYITIKEPTNEKQKTLRLYLSSILVAGKHKAKNKNPKHLSSILCNKHNE